jgi:hypothetical protein
MNQDGHWGQLHVTGCYRSGTTLLEKLLHAHPEVTLASQPCPILYFSAKSAFLSTFGYRQRYPLDTLLGDQAERLDEFHRYLDGHTFDQQAVYELFDSLRSYRRGLWTPEILDAKFRVQPGTFLEVLRQINGEIRTLFGSERSRIVGGKEVLTEEFVPYLVERGHNVVLSVRDPRDMICSLNFGPRDNLTGENRPVLYSLRVWRKSVAVALAYEHHPNFEWVRYEDLARSPLPVLDRLAAFLGVEPFPDDLFENGIRDQYGKLWMGNSSFSDKRGISTGSIGRYRTQLPDSVRAYVESCCLPEMMRLGYPGVSAESFDGDAIQGYSDPFADIHTSFPPDYSAEPGRVSDELIRWKMLTAAEEPAPVEIKRRFIFPEAFTALRRHLKQQRIEPDAT